MRYKPYPKYKPSGVEWLGNVPDSWSTSRLKWTVTFQRGHDLPADTREEGSIPLLTSSGFSGTHNESIAKGPGIVTGRYGTIGQFYMVKEDYWPINTTLYSIDLHGNDCRFLMYMLLPLEPLFLLHANKSAVPGIDRNDIHQLEVALPSRSEQKAIAAFLDRETGRIDRLVEKKRELIEKLGEKRRALISRCVTRGLPPAAAQAAGLNPHPKLKPTGIDWLGEIPEHWEVKRLRFLTPQITVGIVVEPSKYYVDEGIAALRSLNVKEMKISDEGLIYISPEANELHRKSMIFQGDLVAIRSGQPGTTAVVGEQYDGANCIDLIVIRKPLDADERFLAHFLNSSSARAQFTLGTGGAIQQHFNIATAASLLVPVSSLTEQTAIASYLDAETAKIDKLIGKVEEAIERLTEYRSALITAAVTGKIDVREECAT